MSVIVATLFVGCESDTPRPTPATAAKPTVYVVNYPLQYFCERIAGESIDVRFPAPSDVDPAFWKPTGDEIAAFQSADLILLNGADYAKWVRAASLPSSKTVNTLARPLESFIETEGTVKHKHGPRGEHDHGGTAFTTWLAFQQAEQQASAVKDALTRLLPEQSATFLENLASLRTDLTELDADMQSLARRIGDQPLTASHPVYQYLARRYALDIRAVHWEPDVVPAQSDVEDLNRLLAGHPAKWMVWEGRPDPKSVELLRELGVRSVVFDPAGNVPDQGDWLDVMRQNVANLEAVVADER